MLAAFHSVSETVTVLFYLSFVKFHMLICFLKRFFAQTVCTMCARINYKIVRATSLNKYLQYGTV